MGELKLESEIKKSQIFFLFSFFLFYYFTILGDIIPCLIKKKHFKQIFNENNGVSVRSSNFKNTVGQTIKFTANKKNKAIKFI